MTKTLSLLAVAAFLAASCATQETPKPAPAPEPTPAPAPAPKPAPAPAPKPAPKPVAEKVTFSTDVLFDFDKAALRPVAEDNLGKLAESLRKYPGENVLIVGHTDNVGTASYNERLSQERAQSAAGYLKQQGIDAGRILTRGMGEGDPVASNATAEGRQLNRRVELALYAGDAWKKQAEQVGLR